MGFKINMRCPMYEKCQVSSENANSSETADK